MGIDHKSFGVQLARRDGLRPAEWAIAGHHGGLTRKAEVDGLFGDEEQEQALRAGPWQDAEAGLRTAVPEMFSEVPALPDIFRGADRLAGEFAVRFLFSALVDADVLDTRAHRLGEATPQVGPDLDASAVLETFLHRRQEFLARRKAAPMDELRERLFAAAVHTGVREPGVFRMTAPTGAAKTIAAAGFGLTHAAQHGKRRVIVAVPFITITEQNAAVYRCLLDPADPEEARVVLEHHSATELDPPSSRRHPDWSRLAAENWDAPFIITTTVQLFESLFGRRPSEMRKVHRLAHSVIVLDEVQALPHRLLPQVADAIRILTTHFGATVLLSSATQPELGDLRPLHELPATEVTPDAPGVFVGAKRVRYRWMTSPRPTLAEVVREAAGHRQALMVVNTVRDARVAYQLTREVATPDTIVLHLSTGMCGAHRRRVLAETTKRLRAKEPILLVSTSLVEAGVDLDFPVVYRAVAPPESVAQAAGRCNREGHLDAAGLVVVFDPVDGGVPPSYRTQIAKAQRYFGPDLADPDDIEALRHYFVDLYSTLGIEDQGSVSSVIEQNRRIWDFRAVADGPLRSGGSTDRDRSKAFKLILDDTVPVVVLYGDDNERAVIASWLKQLRGPLPDREHLRRLQPYTTTVRRTTAARRDVAALLSPVIGDLVEWQGDYDDGFGLVLDNEGGDILW